MALKFDGKNLKKGSTTLANLNNDKIYEGYNRSKTICNINNEKVYEGYNRSKTLCNVYNGKIYEGYNRSKTLTTIKDAQKLIQGNMNDTTLAAFWFFFQNS